MSLAPLLALHEALQEAEQFIAGFENDPHQENDVGRLLKKLRGQLDVTRLVVDVTRAQAAADAADAILAEGAAAAMPEAAPIRTATLAEVLDRASATIWDAERTLDRLSEGSPLWNHWYGRMCGLYTLLQCCGALPVGPFGRSAHELQGLLKAARPQLPGGFETFPVCEAHQWLREQGIQASADEVPHLQRHLVAGLIKQKQVVEPATGGVHHELLAVNADLQNSANPHSTSVGRSPQGETTAHGDQPWN